MKLSRPWFKPRARMLAVAPLASLPFFSRRPPAASANETGAADKRPALVRSAEASGAVFSLVVSLTLTALVLALLLAVAKELLQPSTYVEPFSVPPDLQARGDTPAVVTERVLDEIRIIQSRSLTLNKAWALTLWGLVLADEGRRDDAALRWREALALDPTVLPATTNLATALLRQGRIDEAMTLTDRRAALPMDDAARARMGYLYWPGGRFEQALALFDARLRADPGQRRAMLDRGWLLFEAKRADEADAALAAFTKSHPPSAANMQGYGRITRWLAERGEIDAVRALPERLETLNLGRRDSTPAFSRAVLALVNNDLVRARNEVLAAVSVDSGPPVQELAGHVFLASGDARAAMKYYAQVLQDNPLQIDARLGTAWAQGALGQAPAGLTLAEDVLRIAPAYPVAHAVRGRLLRQWNREPEALAAFAEARRQVALRKLPPASLLVRAVEAAASAVPAGG